jgi:cell division FtsZ-interacting protein ZapD
MAICPVKSTSVCDKLQRQTANGKRQTAANGKRQTIMNTGRLMRLKQ